MRTGLVLFALAAGSALAKAPCGNPALVPGYMGTEGTVLWAEP